MTGNAGPILLITNKGRTIRKLMRGGGGRGRCTKKIVAQGNEKKFNARQLTLKKIFILRPKKIHTRNLITKKKMIVLFLIFWREFCIHTCTHRYIFIGSSHRAFQSQCYSKSNKHRKLKTRKIIN